MMHLRVTSATFALVIGAVMLVTAGATTAASGGGVGAGADWICTGGERGGSRYSRLDQINRRNARDLRVAWTYHTGDADPKIASNIECTPVVVDGVMYLTTCSPRPKVVALDAAAGRERWRYDPWDGGPRRPIIASGGVSRGVAYWSDGKRGGARRILHGTTDGRLISLDATNGRPDPGFGNGGVVDLRAGMGRDLSRLAYGMTSPPAIYRELAICGFTTGEGPGPSAPGDVRAFDVRTGRQVWGFRTVPQPGEPGHETWHGDSWKERGGCNAWSGAAVDERRGVVFAGLGSPAFDFYGGDRPGANLFGNCTVALDARTGKRLWHFQVVHHDLWDYDLPCPPVLCEIRQNGRRREVAAQVTKTGYCFLFDRRTGKPIIPVEERPVPESDLPGEASFSTQPVPLKPPPFARQGFGEADVTDISPAARASVLERIRTMRIGPAFTPTGLQATVRLPGFHGGASWAGASADPTTGMLYLNSNNIPREHALKKAPPDAGYAYTSTGIARFTDHEGYPAVKPPWGVLTAIDLNRGEFAWQKVLGQYPELTARGIPPTGTESLGGTIVTAGGLVFVAGTKDEKIRAFDKRDGRLLWEYRLPAAGYATPCTYSVNGRQYVAIAAGGGGKLMTPSGDSFVAFALP